MDIDNHNILFKNKLHQVRIFVCLLQQPRVMLCLLYEMQSSEGCEEK